MKAGAKKKLAQYNYTGEKRNWNFEKHAALHKEKHNILEILKEHGYTDIDHISKVSYLSEGINTTSLDSGKTCTMLDEILCQDFYGCVTFYKEFLKQSSADFRQSLGISESSTKKCQWQQKYYISPEERYYDSNEWYALSKNYKEMVLKACSNINGGKKSTK